MLYCERSCAGLGDGAVPGVLAGLALRYYASRATDMKGRAQAAGEAMMQSLADLQVHCVPSNRHVTCCSM